MVLTAAEFVPIPIHEFVNGVTIQVDLYVRLSEEKFVMVGKAGTHSNVDQFRSYQNRAVVYLWVRKREYYKISHQSIQLAGIVLSKKDLDESQKTALVTHAARSVFRHFEHMGIDLEAYSNSKQITEAVVSIVESSQSLANIFMSLRAVSDQLLSHSMAVSALSVMIGQELGFEKRSTLEKLAMGGLLHDIGMKAMPPELLKKPLAQMTPDELALYETHAFKGMQMLQSLGVVQDDIVSMIYEHHENSIGQGFPQRLRDVRMHPLAKVIALADGYTNLILPNVNCPVPKNLREALMYIEHTLGIPYNRDAFRALKRIIGTSELKAA